MITNVEQDRRHFLRGGTRIPEVSKRLEERFGRTPTGAIRMQVDSSTFIWHAVLQR